jgi:NDP-sugar pyrophosphorylase family protein
MQAVILAAGRGTRMKDLTESLPKPMLQVHGRTLLEHKFDLLIGSVEEIILIVGYQASVIMDTYGELYKGMRIRYILQEELNGTMGALALAQAHLTDEFVVMMGDDIYCKADLTALSTCTDWGMVVFETPSMASGGRICVDATGVVTAIEEGDHTGEPGLMNTNMLKLDTRLFSFPLVPKAVGSDEYGLPQTVVTASKQGGIPLACVLSKKWIQVTSPEDIIHAEHLLQD